jgi:hypothetical protein
VAAARENGITRINPDAFELTLDTFEEYSER